MFAKKCFMQNSTGFGQITRSFLLGHLLPPNTLLNGAWLILRLHMGLSLAIHAGWPKMADGLAPDWFVKQVGEIGFTFLSPVLWATLASWGEFIGGLLLAFGLFTRFNAIQLLFQFFVISYIWYEEPELITGMYFQQTLFMCYLLFSVGGGGKFSLDAWINKFFISKSNKSAAKASTPISSAIMQAKIV
jgi:uncharacterized membrane protein YphA (DoxX/SURF4 family)